MAATTPKKIKLTVERVVSLTCPECEEVLNTGTQWGYVTRNDWKDVPQSTTCPSCGTALVLPQRNPFGRE